MSHFTVGVILPKIFHEDMQAVIAELLAPYDENTQVDAYPKPCYCVGNVALRHGHEMADKLVGTWSAKKQAFWDRADVKALDAEKSAAHFNEDDATYERLDAQQDALWEEHIAAFKQDWYATEREYTENHPAYGQPCSDCDECNGTGTYMSTYNPKSEWDWWRVGGRWDGQLVGNEQFSENGFNFDPKHETISNNSLPVNELLQRYEQTGELFTFFALVTPEGVWIEKGDMGWWGMVADEKKPEDWREQSLKIYSLYAGHDVVLVDAHI